MKKTLLLFAMLLSVIAASAKDVKTVVFTTTPVMHCENCENKIKTNLRFEKGVKDIQTNVEQQRVTVAYDASKTDAGKLQKAFGKFGYEAKVVECGADKKVGTCCKDQKKASCCGGCKSDAKNDCGGCKSDK